MTNPTPADRLALAMCVAVLPGSKPCQSPCHSCRQQAAAVVRELAEQVVPEEPGKFQQFTNEAIRLNQMGIRAEILARATELEGE